MLEHIWSMLFRLQCQRMWAQESEKNFQPPQIDSHSINKGAFLDFGLSYMNKGHVCRLSRVLSSLKSTD